jgi:hypothetical protein
VSAQRPFDPRSGDALEVATLDLFQYAIGNTDWSAVHGHNVLRVESATGAVTPVPYDFDFSGLVDAEYATVAPQLGTRSVRQRVFRGVCRPDVNWTAVFDHFEARRDAVLRLANEVPSLEDDERADVVDYLGSAFAAFASPAERERNITGGCRGAVAR